MTKRLIICITAVILALTQLPCMGQRKQVYTRKMRIEDFPARTTKVVVSGESLPDLAFREEVASRWNISAYEFCNLAEYEKIKENNKFYFLRLVQDSEVLYIELSKGGKEKDDNALNRALDIVRVPVSRVDTSDGRMFIYLAAFIDIIQDYMDKALVTGMASYTGLQTFNTHIPKDATVIVDEAEADKAFAAGEPGTLVGLSIGKYSMIIDAGTHKLLQYSASGKDLKKRYGQQSTQ